jgi:D-glycero-D-manno-heptose 1,7-bisphosphate phosphatase
MAGSVKLYVFDADGTLRWTAIPGRKYPLASSEWRLMPGVAARLRAIPWSAEGPWLAIASNQNGVAAGELSEEHARTLIGEMLTEALGCVPENTRIELCTCDERIGCACRKPAPGLLLRLLEHYDVAPADALFVGDLDSDAEAARRAGVAFMWADQFFLAPGSDSSLSSS